MNGAISFFVGCITFVLMMVIKIPIKRLVLSVVEQRIYEEEEQYVWYKRWNTVLLLVTLLVSAVVYYFVGAFLEIDHFKWCCSIKAGAIAIALYAVYEQWFGVAEAEEDD